MLRLRVERRQRRWTQSDLAERTGLDVSTISRLETGRLHPYAGWKQRLSDLLEVPGDDLFKEVAASGSEEIAG